MHRLEEQLEAFRAALRRPDLPVVLAVSGGADSVALLRAWHATDREGWGRALVAHFNHQWRGDESRLDEVFVQELAGSLGLRSVVGRPADGAASSARGPSREATARHQRYTFLTQVAAQQGARYLATAHSADDQAETILLRILRGTGVAGLVGIPRFRRLAEELTLVRPLLEVSRDELRRYLVDLGQGFREDSSNADPRFARNRVRRDLLPLLRQHYNRDIDGAIRRLGDSARETLQARTEIIERLAADAVSTRPDGDISIDCAKLADVPRDVVRQLFVHLWTREHWPAGDMNRQRWIELAELTRSDPTATGAAPRMFPGRIRAVVVSGVLTLGPIKPSDRRAD